MSAAALRADFAVARGASRVEAQLEVARGELVALIGPSGAGKSTILEAVAGRAPLTEGTIVVDGRVVSSARVHVPAARRGVVLLDQDARLFPHLTALENVAFGLRVRGAPKAAALDRASGWLDRVGLAGLAGRMPRQLSGGQQQRVALARALAVEPALVLLDEPFSSLDVETAVDTRDVVQEQLAATAASAVIVTHAVEDAAAVAGRALVVEAGRVVQAGALRDVLERPATRFAAAFAGVNRIEGAVHAGSWSDGGALRLATGDWTAPDGAASAVFAPGDVVLGRDDEPGPAGALALRAEVHSVRQLASGVRVVVRRGAGDAARIAIDVARDRAAALTPAVGDRVLAWIAPGHVRLVPAPLSPGAPTAPGGRSVEP